MANGSKKGPIVWGILAAIGLPIYWILKESALDALFAQFNQWLAAQLGIRGAEVVAALGAYIVPGLALCAGFWGAYRLGAWRTSAANTERSDAALRDWAPLEDVVKWLMHSQHVSGFNLIEMTDLIRNAAVSGRLTIRGLAEIGREDRNRRFDNVPTEIPASYWKTHSIELSGCLNPAVGRAGPDTLTIGGLEPKPDMHYRRLQADMRQVKEIWQ